MENKSYIQEQSKQQKVHDYILGNYKSEYSQGNLDMETSTVNSILKRLISKEISPEKALKEYEKVMSGRNHR